DQLPAARRGHQALRRGAVALPGRGPSGLDAAGRACPGAAGFPARGRDHRGAMTDEGTDGDTAMAQTLDERGGWPVVLGCFCMALFAWGVGFYGQAVFLAELQRQHGWSSGLIGSATTFYYLVGAVLMTWFAAAHRRLGARRLVAGAIVLAGLGALAMPF